MGHLPFFQFYPLDWLADTAILSNEAKGIYIDILCQLWLSETPGQRTWYKKEFTTMLRLFDHEHDVEGPIYELTSVCEVDFRDSDDIICDFVNCTTVTIISRRMTRDWTKLSKLKDKHKRYNDRRTTAKRPDNDRKTTDRSQKSEVRSQNPPYSPPKGGLRVVDLAFDRFWKAYPRKVGKEAALKAWAKEAKLYSDIQEAIFAALEWQVDQPQWKREGGDYIPHPATYLNQRRWQDQKTKVDPMFLRESDAQAIREFLNTV